MQALAGRPARAHAQPARLSEATLHTLERLSVCPISWAPPFGPPWKRALAPAVVRRISGWCAELLPGVLVEVEEWVGADPRQPIHALVVGFPASQRSPLVLYQKSEELERHHLARAVQEVDVPEESSLGAAGKPELVRPAVAAEHAHL